MKDTTKNVDENIFASNSQLLHGIKADEVRPIYDRILVRDTKDPDRIGSIWIPETAAERGVGKNGLLRLGVVVAIGPGDPFKKEWVERDNLTGQHHVRRKSLGGCPDCDGHGWVCPSGAKVTRMRLLRGPLWENGVQVEPSLIRCEACHGDGVKRWPMLCRVGDTILYERRKESELFIGGVRHGLIYELQAVMAVMEGA